MKKLTKQVLALLLTICTLVSIAMPTVFATGEAEELPGGETTAPETVVYAFGNEALNGECLNNQTAAIKEAYDAGAGNWRYEAASSAYQFRVKDQHEGVTSNGNNKFEDGSLQFIGGNNAWYALRLQSPGAGKYALALSKTAASDGAAVKVYILKASAIDEALGENAAAYAQEMSADPYLAGASEGFAALKAVIGNAIGNTASVMEADFTEDTPAIGSYTFEENEEYVLALKLTGTGTVRVLFHYNVLLF